MTVALYAEVFVGLLLGLPLGYLAHEAAHYVVLAAAGRQPQFDWQQLSNPSVSYSVPAGRTPLDVRVAALAPALLGLVAVGGIVGSVLLGSRFLFAFCIGLCPRLFWLSPKDRRTVLKV